MQAAMSEFVQFLEGRDGGVRQSTENEELMEPRSPSGREDSRGLSKQLEDSNKLPPPSTIDELVFEFLGISEAEQNSAATSLCIPRDVVPSGRSNFKPAEPKTYAIDGSNESYGGNWDEGLLENDYDYPCLSSYAHEVVIRTETQSSGTGDKETPDRLVANTNDYSLDVLAQEKLDVQGFQVEEALHMASAPNVMCKNVIDTLQEESTFFEDMGFDMRNSSELKDCKSYYESSTSEMNVEGSPEDVSPACSNLHIVPMSDGMMDEVTTSPPEEFAAPLRGDGSTEMAQMSSPDVAKVPISAGVEQPSSMSPPTCQAVASTSQRAVLDLLSCCGKYGLVVKNQIVLPYSGDTILSENDPLDTQDYGMPKLVRADDTVPPVADQIYDSPPELDPVEQPSNTSKKGLKTTSSTVASAAGEDLSKSTKKVTLDVVPETMPEVTSPEEFNDSLGKIVPSFTPDIYNQIPAYMNEIYDVRAILDSTCSAPAGGGGSLPLLPVTEEPKVYKSFKKVITNSPAKNSRAPDVKSKSSGGVDKGFVRDLLRSVNRGPNSLSGPNCVVEFTNMPPNKLPIRKKVSSTHEKRLESNQSDHTLGALVFNTSTSIGTKNVHSVSVQPKNTSTVVQASSPKVEFKSLPDLRALLDICGVRSMDKVSSNLGIMDRSSVKSTSFRRVISSEHSSTSRVNSVFDDLSKNSENIKKDTTCSTSSATSSPSLRKTTTIIANVAQDMVNGVQVSVPQTVENMRAKKPTQIKAQEKSIASTSVKVLSKKCIPPQEFKVSLPISSLDLKSVKPKDSSEVFLGVRTPTVAQRKQYAVPETDSKSLIRESPTIEKRNDQPLTETSLKGSVNILSDIPCDRIEVSSVLSSTLAQAKCSRSKILPKGMMGALDESTALNQAIKDSTRSGEKNRDIPIMTALVSSDTSENTSSPMVVPQESDKNNLNSETDCTLSDRLSPKVLKEVEGVHSLNVSLKHPKTTNSPSSVINALEKHNTSSGVGNLASTSSETTNSSIDVNNSFNKITGTSKPMCHVSVNQKSDTSSSQILVQEMEQTNALKEHPVIEVVNSLIQSSSKLPDLIEDSSEKHEARTVVVAPVAVEGHSKSPLKDVVVKGKTSQSECVTEKSKAKSSLDVVKQRKPTSSRPVDSQKVTSPRNQQKNVSLKMEKITSNSPQNSEGKEISMSKEVTDQQKLVPAHFVVEEATSSSVQKPKLLSKDGDKNIINSKPEIVIEKSNEVLSENVDKHRTHSLKTPSSLEKVEKSKLELLSPEKRKTRVSQDLTNTSAVRTILEADGKDTQFKAREMAQKQVYPTPKDLSGQSKTSLTQNLVENNILLQASMEKRKESSKKSALNVPKPFMPSGTIQKQKIVSTQVADSKSKTTILNDDQTTPSSSQFVVDEPKTVPSQDVVNKTNISLSKNIINKTKTASAVSAVDEGVAKPSHFEVDETQAVSVAAEVEKPKTVVTNDVVDKSLIETSKVCKKIPPQELTETCREKVQGTVDQCSSKTKVVDKKKVLQFEEVVERKSASPCKVPIDKTKKTLSQVDVEKLKEKEPHAAWKEVTHTSQEVGGKEVAQSIEVIVEKNIVVDKQKIESKKIVVDKQKTESKKVVVDKQKTESKKVVVDKPKTSISQNVTEKHTEKVQNAVGKECIRTSRKDTMKRMISVAPDEEVVERTLKLDKPKSALLKVVDERSKTLPSRDAAEKARGEFQDTCEKECSRTLQEVVEKKEDAKSNEVVGQMKPTVDQPKSASSKVLTEKTKKPWSQDVAERHRGKVQDMTVKESSQICQEVLGKKDGARSNEVVGEINHTVNKSKTALLNVLVDKKKTAVTQGLEKRQEKDRDVRTAALTAVVDKIKKAAVEKDCSTTSQEVLINRKSAQSNEAVVNKSKTPFSKVVVDETKTAVRQDVEKGQGKGRVVTKKVSSQTLQEMEEQKTVAQSREVVREIEPTENESIVPSSKDTIDKTKSTTTQDMAEKRRDKTMSEKESPLPLHPNVEKKKGSKSVVTSDEIKTPTNKSKTTLLRALDESAKITTPLSVAQIQKQNVQAETEKEIPQILQDTTEKKKCAGTNEVVNVMKPVVDKPRSTLSEAVVEPPKTITTKDVSAEHRNDDQDATEKLSSQISKDVDKNSCALPKEVVFEREPAIDKPKTVYIKDSIDNTKKTTDNMIEKLKEKVQDEEYPQDLSEVVSKRKTGQISKAVVDIKASPSNVVTGNVESASKEESRKLRTSSSGDLVQESKTAPSRDEVEEGKVAPQDVTKRHMVGLKKSKSSDLLVGMVNSRTTKMVRDARQLSLDSLASKKHVKVDKGKKPALGHWRIVKHDIETTIEDSGPVVSQSKINDRTQEQSKPRLRNKSDSSTEGKSSGGANLVSAASGAKPVENTDKVRIKQWKPAVAEDTKACTLSDSKEENKVRLRTRSETSNERKLKDEGTPNSVVCEGQVHTNNSVHEQVVVSEKRTTKQNKEISSRESSIIPTNTKGVECSRKCLVKQSNKSSAVNTKSLALPNMAETVMGEHHIRLRTRKETSVDKNVRDMKNLTNHSIKEPAENVIESVVTKETNVLGGKPTCEAQVPDLVREETKARLRTRSETTNEKKFHDTSSSQLTDNDISLSQELATTVFKPSLKLAKEVANVDVRSPARFSRSDCRQEDNKLRLRTRSDTSTEKKMKNDDTSNLSINKSQTTFETVPKLVDGAGKVSVYDFIDDDESQSNIHSIDQFRNLSGKPGKNKRSPQPVSGLSALAVEDANKLNNSARKPRSDSVKTTSGKNSRKSSPKKILVKKGIIVLEKVDKEDVCDERKSSKSPERANAEVKKVDGNSLCVENRSGSKEGVATRSRSRDLENDDDLSPTRVLRSKMKQTVSSVANHIADAIATDSKEDESISTEITSSQKVKVASKAMPSKPEPGSKCDSTTLDTTFSKHLTALTKNNVQNLGLEDGECSLTRRKTRSSIKPNIQIGENSIQHSSQLTKDNLLVSKLRLPASKQINLSPVILNYEGGSAEYCIRQPEQVNPVDERNKATFQKGLLEDEDSLSDTVSLKSEKVGDELKLIIKRLRKPVQDDKTDSSKAADSDVVQKSARETYQADFISKEKVKPMNTIADVVCEVQPNQSSMLSSQDNTVCNAEAVSLKTPPMGTVVSPEPDNIQAVNDMSQHGEPEGAKSSTRTAQMRSLVVPEGVEQGGKEHVSFKRDKDRGEKKRLARERSILDNKPHISQSLEVLQNKPQNPIVDSLSRGKSVQQPLSCDGNVKSSSRNSSPSKTPRSSILESNKLETHSITDETMNEREDSPSRRVTRSSLTITSDSPLVKPLIKKDDLENDSSRPRRGSNGSIAASNTITRNDAMSEPPRLKNQKVSKGTHKQLGKRSISQLENTESFQGAFPIKPKLRKIEAIVKDDVIKAPIKSKRLSNTDKSVPSSEVVVLLRSGKESKSSETNSKVREPIDGVKKPVSQSSTAQDKTPALNKDVPTKADLPETSYPVTTVTSDEIAKSPEKQHKPEENSSSRRKSKTILPIKKSASKGLSEIAHKTSVKDVCLASESLDKILREEGIKEVPSSFDILAQSPGKSPDSTTQSRADIVISKLVQEPLIVNTQKISEDSQGVTSTTEIETLPIVVTETQPLLDRVIKDHDVNRGKKEDENVSSTTIDSKLCSIPFSDSKYVDHKKKNVVKSTHTSRESTDKSSATRDKQSKKASIEPSISDKTIPELVSKQLKGLNLEVQVVHKQSPSDSSDTGDLSPEYDVGHPRRKIWRVNPDLNRPSSDHTVVRVQSRENELSNIKSLSDEERKKTPLKKRQVWVDNNVVNVEQIDGNSRLAEKNTPNESKATSPTSLVDHLRHSIYNILSAGPADKNPPTTQNADSRSSSKEEATKLTSDRKTINYKKKKSLWNVKAKYSEKCVTMRGSSQRRRALQKSSRLVLSFFHRKVKPKLKRATKKHVKHAKPRSTKKARKQRLGSLDFDKTMGTSTKCEDPKVLKSLSSNQEAIEAKLVQNEVVKPAISNILASQGCKEHEPSTIIRSSLPVTPHTYKALTVDPCEDEEASPQYSPLRPRDQEHISQELPLKAHTGNITPSTCEWSKQSTQCRLIMSACTADEFVDPSTSEVVPRGRKRCKEFVPKPIERSHSFSNSVPSGPKVEQLKTRSISHPALPFSVQSPLPVDLSFHRKRSLSSDSNSDLDQDVITNPTNIGKLDLNGPNPMFSSSTGDTVTFNLSKNQVVCQKPTSKICINLPFEPMLQMNVPMSDHMNSPIPLMNVPMGDQLTSPMPASKIQMSDQLRSSMPPINVQMSDQLHSSMPPMNVPMSDQLHGPIPPMNVPMSDQLHGPMPPMNVPMSELLNVSSSIPIRPIPIPNHKVRTQAIGSYPPLSGNKVQIDNFISSAESSFNEFPRYLYPPVSAFHSMKGNDASNRSPVSNPHKKADHNPLLYTQGTHFMLTPADISNMSSLCPPTIVPSLTPLNRRNKSTRSRRGKSDASSSSSSKISFTNTISSAKAGRSTDTRVNESIGQHPVFNQPEPNGLLYYSGESYNLGRVQNLTPPINMFPTSALPVASEQSHKRTKDKSLLDNKQKALQKVVREFNEGMTSIKDSNIVPNSKGRSKSDVDFTLKENGKLCVKNMSFTQMSDTNVPVPKDVTATLNIAPANSVISSVERIDGNDLLCTRGKNLKPDHCETLSTQQTELLLDKRSTSENLSFTEKVEVAEVIGESEKNHKSLEKCDFVANDPMSDLMRANTPETWGEHKGADHFEIALIVSSASCISSNPVVDNVSPPTSKSKGFGGPNFIPDENRSDRALAGQTSEIDLSLNNLPPVTPVLPELLKPVPPQVDETTFEGVQRISDVSGSNEHAVNTDTATEIEVVIDDLKHQSANEKSSVLLPETHSIRLEETKINSTSDNNTKTDVDIIEFTEIMIDTATTLDTQLTELAPKPETSTKSDIAIPTKNHQLPPKPDDQICLNENSVEPVGSKIVQSATSFSLTSTEQNLRLSSDQLVPENLDVCTDDSISNNAGNHKVDVESDSNGNETITFMPSPIESQIQIKVDSDYVHTSEVLEDGEFDVSSNYIHASEPQETLIDVSDNSHRPVDSVVLDSTSKDNLHEELCPITDSSNPVELAGLCSKVDIEVPQSGKTESKVIEAPADPIIEVLSVISSPDLNSSNVLSDHEDSLHTSDTSLPSSSYSQMTNSTNVEELNSPTEISVNSFSNESVILLSSSDSDSKESFDMDFKSNLNEEDPTHEEGANDETINNVGSNVVSVNSCFDRKRKRSEDEELQSNESFDSPTCQIEKCKKVYPKVKIRPISPTTVDHVVGSGVKIDHSELQVIVKCWQEYCHSSESALQTSTVKKAESDEVTKKTIRDVKVREEPRPQICRYEDLLSRPSTSRDIGAGSSSSFITRNYYKDSKNVSNYLVEREIIRHEINRNQKRTSVRPSFARDVKIYHKNSAIQNRRVEAIASSSRRPSTIADAMSASTPVRSSIPRSYSRILECLRERRNTIQSIESIIPSCKDFINGVSKDAVPGCPTSPRDSLAVAIHSRLSGSEVLPPVTNRLQTNLGAATITVISSDSEDGSPVGTEHAMKDRGEARKKFRRKYGSFIPSCSCPSPSRNPNINVCPTCRKERNHAQGATSPLRSSSTPLYTKVSNVREPERVMKCAVAVGGGEETMAVPNSDAVHLLKALMTLAGRRSPSCETPDLTYGPSRSLSYEDPVPTAHSEVFSLPHEKEVLSPRMTPATDPQFHDLSPHPLSEIAGGSSTRCLQQKPASVEAPCLLEGHDANLQQCNERGGVPRSRAVLSLHTMTPGSSTSILSHPTSEVGDQQVLGRNVGSTPTCQVATPSDSQVPPTPLMLAEAEDSLSTSSRSDEARQILSTIVDSLITPDIHRKILRLLSGEPPSKKRKE